MLYLRLLLALVLSVSLIDLKLMAAETVSHAPSRLQVSSEQFQRIVQHETRLGHQVKTQTILLAQNIEKKDKEKKDKEDKESEPSSTGDFFGGFGNVGGGNSGEAALVIFAVMGLVVIVAWLPYFPILAYEAISGEKEHKFHHMFSLQYTGFIDNSNDSYDDDVRYSKDGSQFGGKYNFYIADHQKVLYGLAAELGTYSVTATEDKTKTTEKFSGAYWLLGPSFFIPTDSWGKGLGFKFDLVAGSSFDGDMGLISRTDISAVYQIPDSGLTFGAGIGALYMHSNGDRGALSHTNELGLTYGLNLGFSL